MENVSILNFHYFIEPFVSAGVSGSNFCPTFWPFAAMPEFILGLEHLKFKSSNESSEAPCFYCEISAQNIGTTSYTMTVRMHSHEQSRSCWVTVTTWFRQTNVFWTKMDVLLSILNGNILSMSRLWVVVYRYYIYNLCQFSVVCSAGMGVQSITAASMGH